MRLLFLCIAIFCAPPVMAERMQSHCLAFVERQPQVPVRLANTGLAKDEVLISFIGHSMYEITTQGNLRVVTDYNGGVQPAPDVVTMNHAHSSHYTDYIDPAIKHVLRGWDPAGGRAEHELELDEMLIRNVTTDIRSAFTGVEPDGNSIFIFEVAGLCIGHLGHIHHEPSEEQYGAIGRLDVVMAPVDGGMTVDLTTMVKMLKRFRASVVLPMHWWGRGSLDRFLSQMQDEFVVERITQGNSVVLSLDTLPRRPTIKVIAPQFWPELDE